MRARLLKPLVILLITLAGVTGCTASGDQANPTATRSTRESDTPAPAKSTPTRTLAPTPTPASALPTPEPTPVSDVLLDGYAKIIADNNAADICNGLRIIPLPYYDGLLQGEAIRTYAIDFVPRDQALLVAGGALYYSVRDNCSEFLADVEAGLISNAAGDAFAFNGAF